MKTQLILAAIKALEAADKRLGNAGLPEYKSGDMLIATECFVAANALHVALTSEFPNIELEAEA